MSRQKCIACYRNAMPDGRFCLQHKQALDSVMSHYRSWVDAYGSISWEDFLKKLSRMRETGCWVKEVIEAELKK